MKPCKASSKAPTKKQIADAAYSLSILWDACENHSKPCQAILDLLDHPERGGMYRKALESLKLTREMVLERMGRQ